MQTEPTVPAKFARKEKRNLTEARKLFNRTINMPKPQQFFRRPLNPKSTAPFKLRLSRKPHSIVALDESLIPKLVNGREKCDACLKRTQTNMRSGFHIHMRQRLPI